MAGADTAGLEKGTLTVPHGRSVAEAVRDVIRQVKADDPMAPVTVAVHSAWAGLSLRRLLASGALGPVSGDRPGLVNVSFMTIARVAELLGAPALAAAGRRPLPAAVRAEAVRAALLDAPGLFETAANHPSTAVALDATLGELRRCPGGLVELLAGRSRRSGEVVRLCRSAQSRLGDWYDETDLARAATAAMRSGTAPPALTEIGHLVTAGLEPLPPALQELVDAFAARAAGTGIPVVIDTQSADLGNPAGSATHVVTCPDPDEEVRTVARRVAAALEGGTPLHRMAIFHPTGTYARLIHQQLAAAGIPFNGPPVRTLATTVAGAALSGLLEMLDGDFRRDEVIGWLASAPILDLEGREVPSTGWDRVSKTAGVVKGASQWADRLASFAAAQETRAAEAEAGTGDDGGAGDWKAASARRAATRATKLAEFVDELAQRLAGGAPGPAARWQDWSAWACGLLDRYLGSVHRHGKWPDEDQESFISVREALESLASLDAVGATPDAVAFRAAVARALDAPAGRVGKFGTGVMVGGLHQGRGTDFDRVWMVGLAEGLLPATRSSGSLLTDEDRQAALELWPEAADGSTRTLDTRATRRTREAESLAAGLAAAGNSGTLTWSRAELRSGRPRLPSRWLLAAVSGLVGRRVGLGDLDAARDESRITEVVSFSDGMARVELGTESAASLHDRDVVELYSWRRRGGELVDHPAALQGPAGAFVRTAAERSAPFSRFSGRIPEGELELARGHSATKLEMYARCPFRWYLAEALGLRPEEAPEERIRMDVRDKGTLVHQILEDFIVGVIAEEPGTVEVMLAHCERRFAEFADSGRVGKALLWDYDKTVIRRELRRFVKEDKGQPVAAELAFGKPGDEFGPVVVQAGGTTVAFSGKADRVDKEPDGTLVVTDYKTGRKERQGDFDADPVIRGTKLQLPIYGRAARAAYGEPDTPVRARYWFVSEGGGFSEVEVDLDESTQSFQSALEVIANGITAGYFPARPGENEFMGFSNCRFCDFDSVCHSDRDRRWEAIRGDDALRSYVELSEGDS